MKPPGRVEPRMAFTHAACVRSPKKEPDRREWEEVSLERGDGTLGSWSHMYSIPRICTVEGPPPEWSVTLSGKQGLGPWPHVLRKLSLLWVVSFLIGWWKSRTRDLPELSPGKEMKVLLTYFSWSNALI